MTRRKKSWRTCGCGRGFYGWLALCKICRYFAREVRLAREGK